MTCQRGIIFGPCTLVDTLTARCGRQVTHTDLKPENMLIGCDNQIKLCDFGMGQRAAAGTMWAVTGELSTLWYRAPELLLRQQPGPQRSYRNLPVQAS